MVELECEFSLVDFYYKFWGKWKRGDKLKDYRMLFMGFVKIRNYVFLIV